MIVWCIRVKNVLCCTVYSSCAHNNLHTCIGAVLVAVDGLGLSFVSLQLFMVALCNRTDHYIFITKAHIDNRKKLVKQQYVIQMSPQHGELRPTSG